MYVCISLSLSLYMLVVVVVWDEWMNGAAFRDMGLSGAGDTAEPMLAARVLPFSATAESPQRRGRF